MNKLLLSQLNETQLHKEIQYVDDSEILLYGHNISDFTLYQFLVSEDSTLASKAKYNALLNYAKKKVVVQQQKEQLKDKLESMKSIDIPEFYGSISNIPLRYYPLNAEMSAFNVYSLECKETNTYHLKIKAFSLNTTSDVISVLVSSEDNSIRSYFLQAYKNYVMTVEDGKAMGIQDFVIKAIARDLPLVKELILETEPEIVADIADIPNLSFFNKVVMKDLDKKKLEVWIDWLDKIATKEHAKIFMQWIGGIFDHKNKNRNMLFLVGGGATAKSVAMNSIYEAITKIMPSGTASINTESNSERWLNSVALGKRFLLVSDSSDLHILNNQVIKTITGNDITKIEFKGKSEFSARLYSRVAVVSNFTPYVSYKNVHESSRFLLIPITAHRSEKFGNITDASYSELLSKGAPDFLKLCYLYYLDAGRPDDFCDPKGFAYNYAREIAHDLTSGSSEKFVQANCELGNKEGYFINRNALMSFLSKFFKADYMTPASIKRMCHEALPEILKMKGIKSIRLLNGDVVITGLRVINPTKITTLEEINSAMDVKEILYNIPAEIIPSGLDEESKRILMKNSYTRHLE